jgi:hypothetical protein
MLRIVRPLRAVFMRDRVPVSPFAHRAPPLPERHREAPGAPETPTAPPTQFLQPTHVIDPEIFSL